MAISLERLARNQALFREANERILELVDDDAHEPIDFLCECSQESCIETVRLRLDEYEQVRSVATQFCIVDGHEIPEIENVVGKNGTYIVVQKTKDHAFMVETDPRTRQVAG